ncbi:MAG: tRNA (guanosine(46)-N7)-methyltransferase TrmB [Betaproteobacteria bacterium]|nr:tRNA (guanosine(46)-N7)-methyltransferase TrmB [Betaproteobacteria bacterium]
MTVPTHRPIRSFVLRQGRVSNAQQRAHDTLLPQFGIAYSPQVIDLDGIFGRHVPKVLEIGFGMGETTAVIAAQHPGNDYLGIEVHTPGVGSLLKTIGEQNLANVRIVQHDAVEVLHNMIAPDSFDGVHIFFPDPWPKKRHHKRRLLQAEFVALLVTRMKPGGYLHVATDWQEYAEHVLEVLRREPRLANTSEGYAPFGAFNDPKSFSHREHRVHREKRRFR